MRSFYALLLGIGAVWADELRFGQCSGVANLADAQ